MHRQEIFLTVTVTWYYIYLDDVYCMKLYNCEIIKWYYIYTDDISCRNLKDAESALQLCKYEGNLCTYVPPICEMLMN